MPNPTDNELVTAFQNGDDEAFAAIYQRHAPRLTVYIWRRCNDWHMAEDLVQEAMLKAARYIPHGTMYDLNGYLILCVRQVWWMRAAQIRIRPETAPLDPHGVYRGHVAYVEDHVLERETIQEVAALLDCLPDEDREVATLKLFYGYDVPGAAQVLGRGRSSVSAAWRRCSRRFVAWAGTKSRHAALEQALILAQHPNAVPVEHQCKVPGCARPRHAYERCEYHAAGMLARRQQLANERYQRSHNDGAGNLGSTAA